MLANSNSNSKKLSILCFHMTNFHAAQPTCTSQGSFCLKENVRGSYETTLHILRLQQMFTHQMQVCPLKKVGKSWQEYKKSCICCQQFANKFVNCWCNVHIHQLEFTNFSLLYEGALTLLLISYQPLPKMKANWQTSSMLIVLRLPRQIYSYELRCKLTITQLYNYNTTIYCIY